MDLIEFNTLKPNLDVFKEYYNITTKIEEVENDDDVW